MKIMTDQVMGKKFVSIVVSFRNESRNLKRHVEALVQQEYPKDRYEIVFVDDGSTDGSLEIVRNEIGEITFPFIRIIRLDWMGTGGARKTGIEASRGDVIAITDADAIPELNWIAQVADSLADGKSDMVGGAIKEVPDLEKIGNHSGFTTYEKTFWFVNIAFSRRVFEKIGGFDRRFKRGSDYDVIARVLDAGFEYTYNPKAVVWHLKIPPSFSKTLKAELKNGEADLLFLVLDGRIFLRNFKRFPLSIKTSIANTIASLFSAPLLATGFLLGSVLGLALAAVPVGAFVFVRARMSKTKKFRLLRAFACIPIGVSLWYYLVKSCRLAFKKRSEETSLSWARQNGSQES